MSFSPIEGGNLCFQVRERHGRARAAPARHADKKKAGTGCRTAVHVPALQCVSQVRECPNNMTAEQASRLKILDEANVYSEIQFAEYGYFFSSLQV